MNYETQKTQDDHFRKVKENSIEIIFYDIGFLDFDEPAVS